jgi:hypothetical protein
MNSADEERIASGRVLNDGSLEPGEHRLNKQGPIRLQRTFGPGAPRKRFYRSAISLAWW